MHKHLPVLIQLQWPCIISNVSLSDDEDKNQEILEKTSLGVHNFKLKKTLNAWDEISRTFNESELPERTLQILGVVGLSYWWC